MSKATDKERLHDYTTHVYGVVAKSLLKGATKKEIKESYEISSWSIEGDGRSQSVAIRLLTEAGVIIRLSLSLSGRDGNYRVLGYEEHAAEYMVKPAFDSTFDKLYSEFGGYRTSVVLAGYKKANEFSDAEAVWVYFHKSDYNVESHEGDKQFYPKELDTERTKGLLQAFVEYFIQKNYFDYVTRYLGLPTGAIEDSNNKCIRLRNFAYFPGSLNDDRLSDYLEEYKFYVEYTQKLHENLLQYQALIASKGGCKSLIEQMRREVLDKINDEALLHLNVDEDAEGYSFDPEKNTQDVVDLNKFILANSDVFTYEYLYGSGDVPLLNLREEEDQEKFSPPDDCNLLVNPDYVAPK